MNRGCDPQNTTQRKRRAGDGGVLQLELMYIHTLAADILCVRINFGLIGSFRERVTGCTYTHM